MPTSYEINPAPDGIAIELTGVGAKRDRLLRAFGECAAGSCSCPTDEYQKLESMDVRPAEDAISIRLTAKPGEQLDAAEIGRCLDYTVEQASH